MFTIEVAAGNKTRPKSLKEGIKMCGFKDMLGWAVDRSKFDVVLESFYLDYFGL